jgi:ABC-2 type transport system permease protein
LVYYYSIYVLGQPPGNVDSGGVWGSYIGLFFLASSYVAIGLFASSTTDNQIISFIIAILVSFIFYIGFESLSGLGFFAFAETFLLKLSINEHYRSMSRGVIDTRDVLYFVGVIVFFLYLTRMVIEKRKW